MQIPGGVTLEEPVPDSFLPPVKALQAWGGSEMPGKWQHLYSPAAMEANGRSDGAEAGAKLMPKEDTPHTRLALNTLPLS